MKFDQNLFRDFKLTLFSRFLDFLNLNPRTTFCRLIVHGHFQEIWVDEFFRLWLVIGKMSEFYSERHIRSIRPLLITLKSPAAPTFFKNFINTCIIPECGNRLELFDTLYLVYHESYSLTIFREIKFTSIIAAGHQN